MKKDCMSDRNDADRAEELNDEILTSSQEKAFKNNNSNVIYNKEMTFGQVKKFTRTQLAKLDIEIGEINSLKKAKEAIISNINKIKQPKDLNKNILKEEQLTEINKRIEENTKIRDGITKPETIIPSDSLDPKIAESIKKRFENILEKTKKTGAKDIDINKDGILNEAVKKERANFKGKITRVQKKIDADKALIKKSDDAELKKEEVIENNIKKARIRKENKNLDNKMEELKKAENKYENALKEMHEVTDETKIDSKALSTNMDKSVIKEYDEMLKKRDPDDIDAGGHNIDLDPRYIGDVRSTPEDFGEATPASPKEISDSIDNLINTSTSDIPKANESSLIQNARTLAESIVNSDLKAIRELGAVVQTQYRTNKSGADVENIVGALSVADQISKNASSKLYRVEEKAGIKYRKAGGSLKFGKNHILGEKNWKLINEDATNYARGIRNADEFSFQDDAYLELIKDIAEGSTKIYNELFSRLSKSEHEFSKDLGSVDNYRNRVFSSEKIGNIDLEYDAKSIISELAKIIEDVQVEMVGKSIGKKKMSEVVARGYWTVLTNSAYGLDEISHHISRGSLADEALDTIIEQLKIIDVEDSITLKELEQVREQISKQVEKNGKDTRKRLLLNETGTLNLISKETGDVVPVKFTSLLESNNRILLESYTNKMSGFISMAETANRYDLPEMKETNFFQKKRAQAIREMKTTNQAEREKIMDMIDFLEAVQYKRPFKSFSQNWTKVAQGLSGLIFSSQLGFLPVTMTQEVGKMAMTVGWKHTLSALKEESITKLMNKLSGTESPDNLNDFMEFMLYNNDLYVHNINVRSDLGENLSETTKGLDKFVNVTDKLAKSASIASGARTMDKMLRDGAGRSIIYKFGEMAKKGNLVDEVFTNERLLANFITKDKMEVIQKNILKYGNYNKKGNLSSIDYSRWSANDPESLSNFSYSIKKFSNHMVQNVDPSSMPKGLQSPMAKIITSLRTFSLTEIDTTLKYNVHMGDRNAGLGLIYTTLMNGLSYSAYIQLNSIGRGDAEEYKEKMLESKRFMLNSIARSGWAMPFTASLDTIYGLASGGESLFYGARSSGNNVDFFGGIPAVGLMQNLAGSAQEIGGALTGRDEFTQSDMNQLRRLLPFSSLPYVRASSNMMIDQLYSE